MFLKDFDYQLDPKLIATEPCNPRDASRLMVINRTEKSINNYHFYDLEKFLKPGDILVFNDSKVLKSRILFEDKRTRFARGRSSNLLREPLKRKMEIFLLRALSDNQWLIIGKPGKALKTGAVFKINSKLEFKIEKVLDSGERIISFSLSGKDLEIELEKIGLPPFPPYIKNSKASFDDYQTIYADKKGSSAAPTAGLHFTQKLMKRLLTKGVKFEFVTLHVGLGTFQPVKTSKIEDHKMHSEFFHIDKNTAQRLSKAKKEGKRIIAVGTTSARVLESVFKDDNLNKVGGFFETDIFIYPGYKWKMVDSLITNFHLPKSSLLLLVSALADRDFVFKAYDQAKRQKYRFYSFGDAMLII